MSFSFGSFRSFLGGGVFHFICFAVGIGVGVVAPDCSGHEESAVEQTLEGRHEMVAPDSARPDVYFTYAIRQLGDGWTAEDVGFTWRRPDGTLVEDSMPADRVSFSLHDHYEIPVVEMVLRREMAQGVCDDESRTPQELTHTCTAAVVIHCTPEQLQRALSAAD